MTPLSLYMTPRPSTYASPAPRPNVEGEEHGGSSQTQENLDSLAKDQQHKELKEQIRRKKRDEEIQALHCVKQ